MGIFLVLKTAGKQTAKMNENYLTSENESMSLNYSSGF
jgi:hypothetical protein